MIHRRDLLAGTVAGTVAVSALAAAPRAAAAARRASAAVSISHEPYLNFERAHALMEANDVDAIVCRLPTNCFYMTSFRPFWWQENFRGYPIAIMTRRPKDPVSMVASAQIYYYMQADAHVSYPYHYYLFTSPDTAVASENGALAATPAKGFRDVGLAPPTAVEAWRSKALAATVNRFPPSADQTRALRTAFHDLGLERARIAVDDATLIEEVASLLPGARVLRGDNLIRRIRQVKPPHVLELSRQAAKANAEAAYAAARSAARPGATYRELHSAFYQEVAARGGTPVGMVINMVSSPLFNAEFKEGDAIFIDCVSEFQMCHGDYGRTVLLGEPPNSMRRATEAAQLGWTSIRERLKPGLRYSEIRAIGREALRREGYDFDVGFTPHNVGLMHTEEPDRPDLPFYVADTILEPGMVLSVDCPVINTGMGGSAHLEDLVVITADGHQAINDLAHPVITV